MNERGSSLTVSRKNPFATCKYQNISRPIPNTMALSVVPWIRGVMGLVLLDVILYCSVVCATHSSNHQLHPTGMPHSLWGFPRCEDATKYTTIVITGGTKGIGRAIIEEYLACPLFANTPIRIFTCARNATDLGACLELWNARPNDSSEAADQTKDIIVSGVVADVSTSEGQSSFIKAVRDWLIDQSEGDSSTNLVPQLDVLINNVGTNIRKPSIQYTTEEINKICSTNLFSMMAITTGLHPFLKRKLGGTSSVINIGSVAGVTCMKSGSIYAMTKAAMNQLTGNWACEWGLADGIRVNCIAPWYISTELAQQVLQDPLYRQSVVDRTPLGRVGIPQEVAALAVFLSLPVAGYITGQVIGVDGGFLRNGFYDSFYRGE